MSNQQSTGCVALKYCLTVLVFGVFSDLVAAQETGRVPVVPKSSAVRSAAAPTSAPNVVAVTEIPAAETTPVKIWMRDAQGQWSAQVLIRKVIKIDGPISGTVQVYANSAYDIYCNGRHLGSGTSADNGKYLDLTQALRQGDNVIALQARRTDLEDPGVGVRVRYHTALTRQTVETDSTWVVAQKALPLWRSYLYNDRAWQEAAVVPSSRTANQALPVPFALAADASSSLLVDPAMASANGTEPNKLEPGAARSARPATQLPPSKLPSAPQIAAQGPVASGPLSQVPITKTPPTAPSQVTPAASSSATPSASVVASTESMNATALQAVQLASGAESGAAAAGEVAPIHFTDESVPTPTNPTVAPDESVKPENPAVRNGDEIELRVPEQFAVEAVASSQIGSLIKIEFDEFGRILASREAGGLIRVDLSLPLNDANRVTTICDQVQAIQGILPLNGSVYVTGVGPEGLGLYLLRDDNNDGKFENVSKICSITGQAGEHGPHALQLGTDRMIYMLLGNHTQLDGPFSDTSPLRRHYEGDLLPRYEDPSGHAAGVKSPGGTLVRLSLDGKHREIVAGGIRNAYSFAFNQQGDIFMHDSDMESDEGTSWYRPTQVYHVFAGADFGWRSGWAKFPAHYPDIVAPIARTGRGSPSGAVVYDHVQFPREYHNAFFTADWATGRIMAIRTIPSGSSYTTEMETFMEGRPLNATDIAVGPQDGALYIALGGRQSAGGIYRVRWTGEVPAALTTYANPWEEIIRAPMFYSAATRQKIAMLKQQLSGWDETLRTIVNNKKNVDTYRTRALDVMQWFGPVPSVAWLSELATAESTAVRRKVASILGTMKDPQAHETLLKLMDDPEILVQRSAGEALLASALPVDVELIKKRLTSSDPTVATIARRLLENQDPELWQVWTTEAADDDLFTRTAIAGLTAQPSLKFAYDCLVGVDQRLEPAPAAEAMLPLLRVTQLALSRGNVDPVQIPAFVEKIAKLFPAEDSRVNRELVYILAYLKATEIQNRYVEYLHNEEIPKLDRWHLAMHIHTIGDRLSIETRMALLEFLEDAKSWPGGGSYQHYVMQASRDIAKTIPSELAISMLERGVELPNGCLMTLSSLPKPLDANTLAKIITLEQQLMDQQDPSSKDLKLGLTAILGEAIADSKCEVRGQVAEQLIETWKNDPNRRQYVSMAMAQAPTMEGAAAANGQAPNVELFWTHFLQSLPQLSSFTADEVFQCFLRMNKTSKNPEHLRHVILLGLRNPGIAPRAIEVLEKWTQLPENNRPGKSIAAWQSWYAANFPSELPADLPKATESSRWTLDEIQKQMNLLVGDSHRGQLVYQQANCANCHVYNAQGQAGVGPDLNGLVQRFSQREIVESLIHPSLVISDRYRAEMIELEDGRVLTGIVTPLADGKIAVVDSQATRTELSKIDIAEIRKAPVSIMPSGLLDNFNAQQVVDLMAYLMQEKRERTAANQ
ncbi:MAG: HEAT repeat domain-containing protein [Planctomycetaceae bacterium]|nr:HEAT repeat domain-containing protein [Planctomycetaceae bacterium]